MSKDGGNGGKTSAQNPGVAFMRAVRTHFQQQEESERDATAKRRAEELEKRGGGEMQSGPTQHDQRERDAAEQRLASMKKETEGVKVKNLASTTNPVVFGRRLSTVGPSSADRIRQRRNSKEAQNHQLSDTSAKGQPNKDKLEELAEKVENVVDPQSVVEQVLDSSPSSTSELAAANQEETKTPPSPRESEIQETGPDQGFSDQSEESSTEVSPLTEENLKLHNQDPEPDLSGVGNAMAEEEQKSATDADSEPDLSGMPGVMQERSEEEQKSARQAGSVDGTDPDRTSEEIEADLEEQEDEIEEDEQNIDEELQGIKAAEGLEEEKEQELEEEIDQNTKKAQQEEQQEESELVEGEHIPPEGHNTPERKARMEEVNQEVAAGKEFKEREEAEARAQTTIDSVSTHSDPLNAAQATKIVNSANAPQSPASKPSASRPGGQSNSGDQASFGGGSQGSASQESGDRVSFGGNSQGGNSPQQPGRAGSPQQPAVRRELSDFDAITDAIQNKVLIPQQLALYSEYYKGQPDLLHDRKLDDLQKFREEVLAKDEGRDFVANIMQNPQFQQEMQQIEASGYKFVNQKFQHQLHDIAWPAPSASGRSSTIRNPQGQAVCTLSEETISKPSNFTLANGSARPVNSYRKINFPARLERPNGPMHLEMALKDENGQNMPDEDVVYFTAHYNKAGNLTEVSSPAPVKFMGQGDDAIGYIERIGSDKKPHVYTLPVTKGNYREMMQEVERHNGLGVNISKGMGQSQVLSREQRVAMGSPTQQQMMGAGVNPQAQQQMMGAGVNPQAQQQTMMHNFHDGAQQGPQSQQFSQNMQKPAPQPKMRPPAPQVDAAIARMQAQIQQKQAVVAEIKSKKGGGKTKKGSPTSALKKAEKAVADIELLNSRKIYTLEKLLHEQSQKNGKTDLMGNSIDTVMGYSLKKADKLVKDYKLNPKITPAEILDTTSRRLMDPKDLLIPPSEVNAALDQLRAQVWQERAKLANIEIAKGSMASRAGMTKDPYFVQVDKVKEIEELNARKIEILWKDPEANRDAVDEIMRQGADELNDGYDTMTAQQRASMKNVLPMPVIYNPQAPNATRGVEQLQSQMRSKQADLAAIRAANPVDPEKLSKAESAMKKIEELNSRKILALQSLLGEGRSTNPQADLAASRVDYVMKQDLSKTNKMLKDLGFKVEAINAVQTPQTRVKQGYEALQDSVKQGYATLQAAHQQMQNMQMSSPVLDAAIQKLQDETQTAIDKAQNLAKKKGIRAPSASKVEEAKAEAEQITEANAKKEKVIKYRFENLSKSSVKDANDAVTTLMAQDGNSQSINNWIKTIDKEEAKVLAEFRAGLHTQTALDQAALDQVLNPPTQKGVPATPQNPVNLVGGDEGVPNQPTTREEFEKLTTEQKKEALFELAKIVRDMQLAEGLYILEKNPEITETEQERRARMEGEWLHHKEFLEKEPDYLLDHHFDRELQTKYFLDRAKAEAKALEESRNKGVESQPAAVNAGQAPSPPPPPPLEEKREEVKTFLANKKGKMADEEQQALYQKVIDIMPLLSQDQIDSLQSNLSSESELTAVINKVIESQTAAVDAGQALSRPPQVGEPVRLKPPLTPPPPVPALEKRREMLVKHVTELQEKATDPGVKNLYENALKKIPTLKEEQVENLLKKNQTPEFSKDLKSLVPPPPPPEKPAGNSLDAMVSAQTTDLTGALKQTAAAEGAKPATPGVVEQDETKAAKPIGTTPPPPPPSETPAAGDKSQNQTSTPPPPEKPAGNSLDDMISKQATGLTGALQQTAAAEGAKPATPGVVESEKDGRGGVRVDVKTMIKRFGKAQNGPPGDPTPKNTPPVAGVNVGNSKGDTGRT